MTQLRPTLAMGNGHVQCLLAHHFITLGGHVYSLVKLKGLFHNK